VGRARLLDAPPGSRGRGISVATGLEGGGQGRHAAVLDNGHAQGHQVGLDVQRPVKGADQH
jgi:hypothetical protein